MALAITPSSTSTFAFAQRQACFDALSLAVVLTGLLQKGLKRGLRALAITHPLFTSTFALAQRGAYTIALALAVVLATLPLATTIRLECSLLVACTLTPHWLQASGPRLLTSLVPSL